MAPAQAARLSGAFFHRTMGRVEGAMRTVYACFQQSNTMRGIRSTAIVALGLVGRECWGWRSAEERASDGGFGGMTCGEGAAATPALVADTTIANQLRQRNSHGPVACDLLASVTQHSGYRLPCIPSRYQHTYIAASCGE
jgi:hypothetical protein